QDNWSRVDERSATADELGHLYDRPPRLNAHHLAMAMVGKCMHRQRAPFISRACPARGRP
ncbi:MAG TPA: hypothetical protein VIL51_09830, partial [Thermoleophilia bacterium]